MIVIVVCFVVALKSARYKIPNWENDVNTSLLSRLHRSTCWRSQYTSSCRSLARPWRAATWTPAWACSSAWENFVNARTTLWVSVALHVVNRTSRLPPDLQRRAVRCRGRGEGGEGDRLQADGGPPQQEHGLLRGARSLLQQGEHHQAHSAAQGGEQQGFAAGFSKFLQSWSAKLNYLPQDRTANLFIWTQTSFALNMTFDPNMTFCFKFHIAHMQN